jgi:hypothetical protein
MLQNATPDINTDDHRQSLHNGASRETQQVDSANRQLRPHDLDDTAPDDGDHIGLVQDTDRSRPNTQPHSPMVRSVRDKRKRRGYRFRIPHQIARGYVHADVLQRQWAYDESTVKYLLRRYGVKDLRSELWRMGKKQDGFGHLLLADFCEVTQFPIWLQSRPIDISRLTLADSLGDISRTPIATALREIVQYVPAWAVEMPLGLVFPMPGVRFMTIHRWERDASDMGTQLLRPGRVGSRDIVWVMEPLGALLDKIDASGRMETCSAEQIVWRRTPNE